MRQHQPSESNRRAAPLFLLAPAACVLLLAGCDVTGINLTGNSPAADKNVDPLKDSSLPGPGISPPPKTQVAASTKPAATPATPLPVVAAPISGATPAVLAGGATKGTTASAGPDLRIGGGGVAPGTATGPGATLGQLPPTTDTFPHTPPAATLTGGQSGSDFDVLQQELVSTRHVAWQKLEMLSGGGGWKYTCSIPTSDPSYCTMIEAKAATPVDAMRAAIDQIDHPPK
jgi:hypothetical protein